jgi:hypothetical protein
MTVRLRGLLSCVGDSHRSMSMKYQITKGARLTANQEQARAQLSQFLTIRQGYQPQTLQMFRR